MSKLPGFEAFRAAKLTEAAGLSPKRAKENLAYMRKSLYLMRYFLAETSTNLDPRKAYQLCVSAPLRTGVRTYAFYPAKERDDFVNQYAEEFGALSLGDATL